MRNAPRLALSEATAERYKRDIAMKQLSTYKKSIAEIAVKVKQNNAFPGVLRACNGYYLFRERRFTGMA